MNILFIGDVQGENSIEKLGNILPDLKQKENIELTVINGENSADANGISRASAQMLFDIGADVITTGNHAFKLKEADDLFNSRAEVLRPANYGQNCPGKGVFIIDFGHCQIAVINIMGTTYMPPCDNPFKCVDDILKKLDTKNIIVDFHAEATSEKKAMGHYLSGRVSAVIGTHTHVQTADETILNNHTAYITDVGMTGVANSIIGCEMNIIEKFTDYYPVKHSFAFGETELNAVIISIDTKTGKAASIKRIKKMI
ncbi:MAG: TIGR00282 family metallophosphoesterase [Oscillospiraceae bacterium]|nr:TIGR00282 family metallophosphoesterase [Oscillospiraceae bacterium]